MLKCDTQLIIFFFIGDFSSKLYFKNPDKSDLGTYSISVSDTDGVSSSFVMDDEGKVLIISNLSSLYHLKCTKICPRKIRKELYNSDIISYALKKKQKRTHGRLCVVTYFSNYHNNESSDNFRQHFIDRDKKMAN